MLSARSLCRMIVSVTLLSLLTKTALAADGSVAGAITVNGQPLATGTISFYDNPNQVFKATITNGRFSIDRVPTGKYRVTIEGNGIEARFSDTTKTTLQVQLLGGNSTFNFDLNTRVTPTKAKAEIKGKLAADIVFKGIYADKMAQACLDLLASCAATDVPTEEAMKEWDDQFLKVQHARCYLHIKFHEPQTVKLASGKSVKVTEFLVLLPLNNGGIWLRAAERAKLYGKYDHPSCLAVQRLLAHAEMVE